MFSDNPISDVAEGVTKGALEWTKDKIVSFIQKLKERKLAFIEERKTIEIAREQYHSDEAKFYGKYVNDKELLFIIRMGLTLRKLENDEERLHKLRGKILKKYDVKGLHVAEFVQNGILNRYVGILIEKLDDIKSLEKGIGIVLNNIEKHALFVKSGNKFRDVIKQAMTVVGAHSPSIFVVSGAKSAAVIVRDCIDKLKDALNDYEIERVSSGEKEILFFKRKIEK